MVIIVIVGLLVAFPSFAIRTGSASAVVPCPHVTFGSPIVGTRGSSPPGVLNPCPGGEWAKTYGGAGFDEARSIQPTSDGGYIVLARTQSWGPSNTNIWLLRLNATGVVLWQKAYGGTSGGYYSWYPEVVRNTPDGGYVVLGNTISATDTNAFVLRLDSAGTLQWQKLYGGAKRDYAYAIDLTSDG